MLILVKIGSLRDIGKLFKKIKWEAPFHKYTNAGHIFVLETKDYDNNITKLEEVLNILQKEDIGFVEVEKDND